MIGDPVRGVHYELALALAPPQTQLLLLSGSVGNPQDIVAWLQRIGRDAVSDFAPGTSGAARGNRSAQSARFTICAVEEFLGTHGRSRASRRSRAGSDFRAAASRRGRNGAIDRQSAMAIRDPLPLSSAQEALAGKQLAKLLRSRVAYHHSGLSYAVRAGLIEPLAKNGQLNVVVATMGLAAGINFSMRSVLVTDTSYMAGNFERHVQPDELLQMFGRAGRRGLDETGYVLIVARHSATGRCAAAPTQTRHAS